MAINQQSVTAIPRARELKWLNDHFDELKSYTGKWIVVDGNRLVAADADYEAAHKKAESAGITRPFIIFIPEPEEQPFIGL